MSGGRTVVSVKLVAEWISERSADRRTAELMKGDLVEMMT
jgi:hypothetical protein